MSSSEQSIKDYLPILSMAGLILIVQVLALFLSAPMEVNDMQAFEDPTQVSNSIYYIGMILVFTLFVLIAIKKNMKWVISLFIYFAIISTLYYVFFALFTLFPISFRICSNCLSSDIYRNNSAALQISRMVRS